MPASSSSVNRLCRIGMMNNRPPWCMWAEILRHANPRKAQIERLQAGGPVGGGRCLDLADARGSEFAERGAVVVVGLGIVGGSSREPGPRGPGGSPGPRWRDGVRTAGSVRRSAAGGARGGPELAGSAQFSRMRICRQGAAQALVNGAVEIVGGRRPGLDEGHDAFLLRGGAPRRDAGFGKSGKRLGGDPGTGTAWRRRSR